MHLPSSFSCLERCSRRNYIPDNIDTVRKSGMSFHQPKEIRFSKTIHLPTATNEENRHY